MKVTYSAGPWLQDDSAWCKKKKDLFHIEVKLYQCTVILFAYPDPAVKQFLLNSNALGLVIPTEPAAGRAAHFCDCLVWALRRLYVTVNNCSHMNIEFRQLRRHHSKKLCQMLDLNVPLSDFHPPADTNSTIHSTRVSSSSFTHTCLGARDELAILTIKMTT